MATLIVIRLVDQPDCDIVAEAVNDPQQAFAGRPLSIRRPLVLRGKNNVEPLSAGSDKAQPVVLMPHQIKSVGTPRKNAIKLFKRYWSRKSPKTGGRPLSLIEIDEVCDLSQSIVILEPTFRLGNVSALELIVLNHIVRGLRPHTCFEFGTFDGRSTLNICANASTGAEVFTLDLPREEINNTLHELDESERKFIEKMDAGKRFKKTHYEKQIRQLFGDSAKFDFSPYEKKVDFIFVDASHSEPNVRRDAVNALCILRYDGGHKGVILFHDYGEWEGVTNALESLAATNPFHNLRSINNTSFAILELP